MKSNKKVIFLTILILYSIEVCQAQAQLTPDESLGAENSTVNSIDEQNDRVENGATRGTNLFHSFAEFNVDQGRGVFFAAPSEIQNIVTRITGGNVSNIFGRLGVLGEANLFLINPNGIIFGENASLDIGGSFVATTANALQFEEQGFYSAANPETPPLLTVQPSVFFFNQVNANSIENNSTAPAGVDPVGNETLGLRVADGSSLLMVGGDLIFSGGTLQARGGNIELGGLKETGKIGLNIQEREFGLIFPKNTALGNITLNQGSEINVRGEDGGSININAQNLNLTDESAIRAGIDFGLGTINSQAGDININAIDAIELTNGSFIAHIVDDNAIGNGGDISLVADSFLLSNNSEINTSPSGRGNGGDININAANSITIADDSSLNAFTFGRGNAGNINLKTNGIISFNGQDNPENIAGIYNDAAISSDGGNGGDINLDAQDIFISNGFELSSSTFSSGNAGNININARDTVSFRGKEGSSAFSIVGFDATGNGGTINVTTGSLSLENGSQLNVITFSSGNAGNINIDARDTVLFDGVTNDSPFESGAFSGIDRDAEGDSGDIKIETDSLFLNNSAVINANSSGSGDAGDIKITANSLSANNGGQIFTTSRGSGNAGNIEIDIAKNIILSGESPTYFARLEEFGADLVDNAGSFSGLFASTSEESTGNSGNIRLNGSNNLDIRVEDNAQIAVNNLGTGEGGNIALQGNSLTIDRGVILAEAIVNQGGDISLGLEGLLLLRNNSQINASAGSDSGRGDGGNIEIDANSVIAFPMENSDITANAFLGNGGRVAIDTQTLFGTEFREELTINNDITASSEFGLAGVVEINTVDLDPIRGLTRLPASFIDPTPLQSCQGQKQQSSFVNIGRGGLPASLDEINTSNVWEDLRVIDRPNYSHNSSNKTEERVLIATPPKQIVEAQGWKVNGRGNVVLTAQAQPSHRISAKDRQQYITCQLF